MDAALIHARHPPWRRVWHPVAPLSGNLSNPQK